MGQGASSETTSDFDRLIEGLQTLRNKFQTDPTFQNTVKSALAIRNFQFPMKGTEEEVTFLLNCVEDNQEKDKIIKELKEALDKERNSHLITILDWQKSSPSIRVDEKLRLSNDAHTSYMAQLLAENEQLRGARNAVIEKERAMEIQKFQMSDQVALILEESDKSLDALKAEKQEMEQQLILKNEAIEALSKKNSQLTEDNWQLDSARKAYHSQIKANTTQIDEITQNNKDLEERLKEVTAELKEVYYQLETHKTAEEIAQIEKKNEEQAATIEILKGELNMATVLKEETEKKLKIVQETKIPNRMQQGAPKPSGPHLPRVNLNAPYPPVRQGGPNPVNRPRAPTSDQVVHSLVDGILNAERSYQNGPWDNYYQSPRLSNLPLVKLPPVNVRAMENELQLVSSKLESTVKEMEQMKKAHAKDMENLRKEMASGMLSARSEPPMYRFGESYDQDRSYITPFHVKTFKDCPRMDPSLARIEAPTRGPQADAFERLFSELSVSAAPSGAPKASSLCAQREAVKAAAKAAAAAREVTAPSANPEVTAPSANPEELAPEAPAPENLESSGSEDSWSTISSNSDYQDA